MAISRLDPAAREAALAALPLWRRDASRDAIVRTIRFDFAAASGFMARVALVAQKADHHPEWSNVHNRVDILLATHDAGGLSSRDVALAREIDAIALGERP